MRAAAVAAVVALVAGCGGGDDAPSSAEEDPEHGHRTGQFEDPFGHRWSVATHVEDVPPAEMEKRAAEAMSG